MGCMKELGDRQATLCARSAVALQDLECESLLIGPSPAVSQSLLPWIFREYERRLLRRRGRHRFVGECYQEQLEAIVVVLNVSPVNGSRLTGRTGCHDENRQSCAVGRLRGRYL